MRVMMLMLVMMSSVSGTWVSIGPDGGNIQALAIDPQGSATLYSIPYEFPDFPNPRVFRSSDGGATWSLVGRLACDSATSLDVDPHERTILYSLVRGSVVVAEHEQRRDLERGCTSRYRGVARI